MAGGGVAVDFYQGIGHIVDYEFNGAKLLKERLDLGAALRVARIRRTIPDPVFDEHIGYRIGIRMRWTLPTAVVEIYIARLEFDQLLAILERLEPLLDGLAHAMAPC